MNKALIAMDKSGSFRVTLAVSTTMVEDARIVHQTSPLATAALGRALTGAAMMGIQMKNDNDKLTMQFKGDGPAGEILVTANGAGEVKGYISNPEVELPLREDGKLNVGGALGIGTLTVIKDMGLKEPYVGKIDFVSGEIADDLTAYFFLSEQQSSSVALGVKIGQDFSAIAAGGMIIQMMPDAKEESIEILEKMIEGMKPISSHVEDAMKNAAGKTDEAVVSEILHEIFKDLPDEFKVEVLEFRNIGWKCDCSRERLEEVVISIGSSELEKIIEEDKEAELVCQFCEKQYHFDEEQLKALLKEAKNK